MKTINKNTSTHSSNTKRSGSLFPLHALKMMMLTIVCVVTRSFIRCFCNLDTDFSHDAMRCSLQIDVICSGFNRFHWNFVSGINFILNNFNGYLRSQSEILNVHFLLTQIIAHTLLRLPFYKLIYAAPHKSNF